MATVPVPTEAAEAATSAPSPATPAPMQTETPQAANLQTQVCYHSLTIREGNVHRHGPPPKPEGSRNPRAAPQYPEVLCQQGQNPPLPKRRRTAPL